MVGGEGYVGVAFGEGWAEETDYVCLDVDCWFGFRRLRVVFWFCRIFLVFIIVF